MNMDAFELNKIAGGILFALLVLFASRVVSNIIIHAPAPAKPGFEVAVTEEETGGGEAKEAAVPLPQLLQQASAEQGASQAKKCAACHTFDAGGANKVGPNLHDIVGKPFASKDGFAYSEAMKSKGGTWTYEDLFAFLESPKRAVPGTKMAFAGIKSDKQRADLLLYLKEQSPNAPPPPAPAKKAQAGDAAPQSGQGGDKAAPQQPTGAGPQEQAPALQQ